jgi:hypothetical protein
MTNKAIEFSSIFDVTKKSFEMIAGWLESPSQRLQYPEQT